MPLTPPSATGDVLLRSVAISDSGDIYVAGQFPQYDESSAVDNPQLEGVDSSKIFYTLGSSKSGCQKATGVDKYTAILMKYDRSVPTSLPRVDFDRLQIRLPPRRIFILMEIEYFRGAQQFTHCWLNSFSVLSFEPAATLILEAFAILFLLLLLTSHTADDDDGS